MTAGPVTLLFTDLVNSTELLARAGDEQAQRIFQAHHRLLQRCVAAHDGAEVKWLGDGLMTVFASTADAVRCAIAMQQAARRRAAGERLAIRVGLNVGEVKRDESDYFGTPVVIARRLCDHAHAGQILCSALVPGMLAGRQAFAFRECGPVELKGLVAPVAACEVVYQHDQPAALLTHTPFVGRVSELARLIAKLRDARAGHGAVVMLAGEPGIGKTRVLEECAETARNEGALVVWGRCYEGEAARPYGPFVEALTEHVRAAPADVLRADLGLGAAPLARLVPVVRERLPDVPEPVSLQPDEERVRLFDAVAQFLIASSARAPIVLALDDLHWADGASIALLRHLARFAARHRLVLLGAYRDTEVPAQHPLTDALSALPRETTNEHLALTGLARTEVEALLEEVAEERVPDALARAITDETSGNPFFIREVLLHLLEEGKIFRREGQWIPNLTLEEMGIPHGVRQVIQRRLSRLSTTANALLRAAAGFAASFRFDLAARVAQLDDAAALDAVDEALAAQLLRPTKISETFDFTHALVRHTLYADLSPPRRSRLHRQIAEAMEQLDPDRLGECAGEIAEHYHRSAALAGAERGVRYAVEAADRAERSAAFVEVVGYLRMALALLPVSDAQRPRLLARFAVALAWSLAPDEAVATATQAAEALARTEGDDSAAEFLADAADAVWMATFSPHVWALAEQGLRYVGARRDATWARLMVYVIEHREAGDPTVPGIPVDSAERREVTARLWSLPSFGHGGQSLFAFMGFRSRDDVLARAGHSPLALVFWAGEYQRALPILAETAATAMERGQIVLASFCIAVTSWVRLTLGDVQGSMAASARAAELHERVGDVPLLRAMIDAASNSQLSVEGSAWELVLARLEKMIAEDTLKNYWTSAMQRSAAAQAAAQCGRREKALEYLESVIPVIDRAPASAMNYPSTIANAVAVLVLLDRCDHAEVIERNLRAKWLEPDFRYPSTDARQSLGNLCGLLGRYEEAAEWFAKSRIVLDEQGARVSRAYTDLSEARMYARRDAPGDRERAVILVDAALEPFNAIGMPGWVRRAHELRAQCVPAASGSSTPTVTLDTASAPRSARETATAETATLAVAILRHEGDYWTLAYGGKTARLKDAKGLHYLAHLLHHAGCEFHALDLVQALGVRGRGSGDDNPARVVPSAGLEVLDATAKSAYKRRLAELREELEQAEQFNDSGRAERLREEIEAIGQQLTAALGLGGRDRKVASAGERARQAVTQRVRAAIKRISQRHPALADHLGRRVETGTFCVYRPDASRPIEWDLG